MGFKRGGSKLQRSYMVSYLLIFLVPLIVITVFIYQSAVNSLRTEIEQSNVNQLNQVRMTIDGRMTELRDIAIRMSYDNSLTRYMVKHPYYSSEAIRRLDQYRANSAIIDDLLLYFHHDSVIYSSEGLSGLHVVFGKTYTFSNWDQQQIKRDLNEIKYPLTRPADRVTVNSRQSSMLVHMVPIKPTAAYPYATVVYLINESRLTGMMNSVLSDFKGNSYIFDNNGHVLTANNHDTLPTPLELGTLSKLTSGIHSMELNGKQQSVVAVESPENGWTYVTTMPSDQFFSRIFHVQTLIVFIFALVALAGIPVALMLARRQYGPLRDLVEFAQNRSAGKGTQTDRGHANGQALHNEWTWIRDTLLHYRDQVGLQQPYVRHQCLLMLMKHGQPDDAETVRLIDGLGLREQGLHYFVMIVSSDALLLRSPAASTASNVELLDETVGSYPSLPDLLSEVDLPQHGARLYGVEYSSSNRLALAVCWHPQRAGESEADQGLNGIVAAVRQLVYTHYSTYPTVGVGNSYTELEAINQSFIEAATAMEYRVIGETSSVTYFNQLHQDDHRAGSSQFWISNESLLKLSQSLKQGNIQVASHMIHYITAGVHAQSLPLPLMRCILFDLLNTVLRTASDAGLLGSLRDMPQLSAFETAEELEGQLQMLAIRICACAEHKQETEQVSLLDQIVAYVEAQYADYALSLEGMAQQFSISSSYLSRTFKDKTGLTFSQYIWQLRRDEVIRQITETDDPLKDIIVRVGYLDTANFIRKFKKEMGCTPGQYRKLHRGEEQQSALEVRDSIS
ncbi:AraC family transcriptional regulator [Paenibacillus campi]|uniref:AraC family transcriptional regulator n=1 Tax=Paenibacillus campi TaxID=3106031 RepID=UPI002AFFDA96|nr:AraC family transcriptional regulator [Paenibacillus sp. SGZ-1014]